MGDGSGSDGSCNRGKSSGTCDLHPPRRREALGRPPPPGLPGTHLSRGTAVRATSLRAASAACGTVHAARGEGRKGPQGVRYKEVRVRREGKEGRPHRGKGMAARPGSGREERREKGGGRESGGGQCSRRGPAEFRFPTPPPRFDLGPSRRPPGAAPDAASGAAGAPRAPRPGGSGGHRLAGAGGTAGQGTPRRRRPGRSPARTPPRQDSRVECEAGREREGGGGLGGGGLGGGGGQARLAPGSAGRKLAGLARGSAARILRPRQRACARGPARRAAGRGPAGRRPLPGAGGMAGGVSAPTPCPPPACPR